MGRHVELLEYRDVEKDTMHVMRVSQNTKEPLYCTVMRYLELLVQKSCANLRASFNLDCRPKGWPCDKL